MDSRHINSICLVDCSMFARTILHCSGYAALQNLWASKPDGLSILNSFSLVCRIVQGTQMDFPGDQQLQKTTLFWFVKAAVLHKKPGMPQR